MCFYARQYVCVLTTIVGFMRDPLGSRRDPVGCRRDPVGCRRDPVGSKRDPVGCRRDLVGCRRDPVGCRRDPVGFGRGPVGESLASSITGTIAEHRRVMHRFVPHVRIAANCACRTPRNMKLSELLGARRQGTSLTSQCYNSMLCGPYRPPHIKVPNMNH